jgi:hypothetical protein
VFDVNMATFDAVLVVQNNDRSEACFNPNAKMIGNKPSS